MAHKWFMMELPNLLTDGHTFKSVIESFQLTGLTLGSHGAASRENGNKGVHTVEITRIQDKYSPVFRNISMDGTGFEQLVITILTFENGAMTNRIYYTFSDVMLEAYLPRNGSFGKAPVETLTFDFGAMNVGP